MENRYSRQIAYFGSKKQEKIEKSAVCIIGCGALGSASAELLARAGTGTIKLIDRDFVEMSNLQRQHLFDENDIDNPKAPQLAEKLKMINSSIRIGYAVTDFNGMNAENLVKGFDLVIDGLDNTNSRFILNEACVKQIVPWIYGSAIRNTGYVSFIDPGKNCFRCFMNKAPSRIETCETSGVTNAITSLISAMQVGEALNFLTKGQAPLDGRLFHADLDKMFMKNFILKRNFECDVCARKEFTLLGKEPSKLASLCGDKSYHISPPSAINLDLEGAAMRLPKGFRIKSANDFLVRAIFNNSEITVFNDGRMITKNMEKSEAEKMFRKVVLT
ncbi:MAG: ThiF family adenylyltransferase [Candidatus Aenigmarchaeota archaeon]|nr:ThiF family adenylyltransferase [Candidatus Aenigmarchaeota archaeon]